MSLRQWPKKSPDLEKLALAVKMDEEPYYLLTKSGHKVKKGSIFGIQGGIGSFNEEAFYSLVGQHANNLCLEYLFTTERVLSYLNEKKINYGIFAFHNSLGGIVEESIEAMRSHYFQIICSFQIPIKHFLMKRKDVLLKENMVVMAHPQVFRQCNQTLLKKYPDFCRRVGEGDLIDTAAAACALSEGRIDKNACILGPKGLARIYNFEIIDSNLQDDKNNLTTFFLVNDPSPRKRIRTSGGC